MSTPRLAGLCLGDDPAAWRAAGFDVDDEGLFVVGGLLLHCTGEGGGVLGWTLANAASTDVDGLPTRTVPAIGPAPRQEHANGASALDHLVVGSPNRDRTVAAFASALGLQPRRQTEHVLYGRPMVQTFFLLPPTLIEVVSRPQAQGEGPATFWGLAFVAPDLDAVHELLGDHAAPPKDAVQPGRRILTVHGSGLGIGVPLAFLTPRAGR